MRNRSREDQKLKLLWKTGCNLVYRRQKAHIESHIRLINHKSVSLMNSQVSRSDQIIDPSRCPNDNMGLGYLELIDLTSLISSPNVVGNPNFFFTMASNLTSRLVNLCCQFPTRRCNDHFDIATILI